MSVDRRLIDVTDGIAEFLEFSPDGSFGLRRIADVEANIEANKRLQTDGTDGWSPTREWRRVASIPLPITLMWLDEGIDVNNKDHWPAVLRKLQDPDWRFLRTDNGTARLS